MRLKPFKFNLENKIVPMAQSILVSNGMHSPMLFTYDKDGKEKVSDLFSITDKEIIYKILGSFLEESNSVAFVLITEAWSKTVRDGEDKEELKDVLEGTSRIRDLPNKEEVLAFQWNFRLSDVRNSGSISYPFKNESGTILIDYDNPTVIDSGMDAELYSRTSNLLASCAGKK